MKSALLVLVTYCSFRQLKEKGIASERERPICSPEMVKERKFSDFAIIDTALMDSVSAFNVPSSSTMV